MSSPRTSTQRELPQTSTASIFFASAAGVTAHARARSGISDANVRFLMVIPSAAFTLTTSGVEHGFPRPAGPARMSRTIRPGDRRGNESVRRLVGVGAVEDRPLDEATLVERARRGDTTAY